MSAPAATSSPLRHWVMQLSLWVVLAGMLGLAMLVRRQHVQARRVELSQVLPIGDLVVRQPIGWSPQRLPDGVVFVEPEQPGRPRRRVEIRHARTPTFLSPLEYLVRAGELPEREALAILQTGVDTQAEKTTGFSTISIAGAPGVLLSQTRELRAARARQPFRFKQVTACTVLATGDVLHLRLEGQGIVEAADEQLVRRLAESLRLKGLPSPRQGLSLTLGEGMGVAMPPGLSTFPVDDPFRTSRTFFVPSLIGWFAVDLTPCVVYDDPAVELEGMLLLRDLAYAPGAVKQVDEQVWQWERDADAPFPAVAYLLVDSSGQGVLAEFRWNRPGATRESELAQVEMFWQEIKNGITFPDRSPLPQLREQGTAALAELPRDPAELLEEGSMKGQAWEWYHADLPYASRVTEEYGSSEKAVGCRRKMPTMPPWSVMGQEESVWRMARDGSWYTFSRQRIGAGFSVGQGSTLAGDKLETTFWRESQRPLMARSDDLGPFIPGGLLPLALGRLPREAMLLRTESILGIPATLLPLNLILHPEEDPTRMLPETNRPMRFWRIEVSGTGVCSRWYLDEDGQLIEVGFANKLHFQRKMPSSTHPATTQVLPGAQEAR